MDTNNMTDEDRLKYKMILKTACSEILMKRLKAAEFVMEQAQESANNEEKSSAGDKHETGRAKSQADRDIISRQVNEAKRELQLLEMIDVSRLYNSFLPGAVAVCDGLMYFMSAGLGSTEIGHNKVLLLSSKAPLAQAMNGKKSGEWVEFNGKQFLITDVF